MRHIQWTDIPIGQSILFVLLAGVSTAALCAHARANDITAPPSVESRIAFDIAPQPLASALTEFARQSGTRALYSYDQLHGLDAPAVRGAYSREEALNQLLSASGYSARIKNGNVLELEKSPRPQQLSAVDRLVPLMAPSSAEGATALSDQTAAPDANAAIDRAPSRRPGALLVHRSLGPVPVLGPVAMSAFRLSEHRPRRRLASSRRAPSVADIDCNLVAKAQSVRTHPPSIGTKMRSGTRHGRER